MSFHEFHEPIQVDTPLGRGRALLVERTQHDYFWTVALDTCALVTFPQDKILIGRSYTHGRGITDEQMETYIRERRELADRGLVPNFEESELLKRRTQAREQALKDALGSLEEYRGRWEDSKRGSERRYYGLSPEGANWMGN